MSGRASSTSTAVPMKIRADPSLPTGSLKISTFRTPRSSIAQPVTATEPVTPVALFSGESIAPAGTVDDAIVVRVIPIDADVFDEPVNANDTVSLLTPDAGSALSNFTPTVKVAGPVPEVGLTVIQGLFGVAVHVTVPVPPPWVSRTV